MSQKYTILLIILVLLGASYFFISGERNVNVVSSPLTTTYTIEEEPLTFVDGLAVKETAPGSATQSSVSLFGEPSFGDIDSDGDEDAVVILVSESGGSGTFYYAAIAVNSDGEYMGTDAILLGDRISPQTYYIEDNRAKINYADRAFGEDFATAPSIGKSIHLQYDPANLRLIYVAVDFEGEADPSRLSLTMKTWRWISTLSSDGSIFTPQKEVFTLTFAEDDTFSATTDCNSMSGAYESAEGAITFSHIAMTKKYCEGSEEANFAYLLEEAETYHFTSKGELIFELARNQGRATFR